MGNKLRFIYRVALVIAGCSIAYTTTLSSGRILLMIGLLAVLPEVLAWAIVKFSAPHQPDAVCTCKMCGVERWRNSMVRIDSIGYFCSEEEAAAYWEALQW